MSQLYTPSNAPIAFDNTPAPSITGMVPPTSGGGDKNPLLKCAAPVFKEIAKKTLHYLGIPPDDPYGYPPGDPRRDTEKGDWIKESEALQKKYLDWNK